MRKYIFAERGGIYLIDLNKTLQGLERAQELVRQTVLDGKSVLFVCTKPQLAGVVRAEAEASGSFYVTERWLGGMLTNFQTIKKNISRLKELERGQEEDAFEYYTKKERLLLEREKEKLDRYLSGIKDMTRLPGLVFVVDSNKEDIAVKEANRLGIPVVAIADTNADPDLLTIAIAGNDDAVRSVSLITKTISEVVESTRNEIPDTASSETKSEVYTYSTDAGDVADTSTSSRRKRPRRKPRPEAIAQRLNQPKVIEDNAEQKLAGDDAAVNSKPSEPEVVEEATKVEEIPEQAQASETDSGTDGGTEEK